MIRSPKTLKPDQRLSGTIFSCNSTKKHQFLDKCLDFPSITGNNCNDGNAT